MGRRRAGRPAAGGDVFWNCAAGGWTALTAAPAGAVSCRLECLQRIVSKLQMEAGLCEEQLNHADALLQSVRGGGARAGGPGQGGGREAGRAGSLPRPVASGWRAGPSSSPGVLPAPVARFGQSWFPGTRQDIREATVPGSRPERLAGQRRWWGGRHTQRAQRGWGCASGQELVEGGAWWRRRGPRNLGGLAPWT